MFYLFKTPKMILNDKSRHIEPLDDEMKQKKQKKDNGAERLHI